MLLVTMSAMLVLFAGCGDKEDGGEKESLATLVAETVSSSTTTNKISTQGPSGITFEATIVSQGGDAEWCSFDLNKQVSSAGGNVGDPAYLYWKDKKIAGILIENDLTGSQISQSIIGIGININQEEFHSSAPNPVSLRQITKKETDRMEVLNSVLEHIIDLYSRIENRETDIITKIQEYYLKAQYRKEGYHPYCDAKGEFTAKLIRVEPDGHLILKDKNGSLRKYAFKEVKYLL